MSSQLLKIPSRKVEELMLDHKGLQLNPNFFNPSNVSGKVRRSRRQKQQFVSLIVHLTSRSTRSSICFLHMV